MELLQVITSRAHLYPEPTESSRLKIEMLFGERAEILGSERGWTKARTMLGGYEGYVKTETLGALLEPTHRVSERIAPMYAEPYFKAPLSTEPLYFNSLVTVEEQKDSDEGLMHRIAGYGWVFDTHLRPIGYRAPDFVDECLKFLGTSYGYEKRGALIDCSTLVQAGCIAAGIECPYDVKTGAMETLGELVETDATFSNLRRGDLVFWTKDKGSHVAIMVDEVNCLHATIADPYRKALIQPLKDVAHDQARNNNGPITSVRRFPDYKPASL